MQVFSLYLNFSVRRDPVSTYRLGDGPPVQCRIVWVGWGAVAWRFAIRWMPALGLRSHTPPVYTFKILKSQTVWLQKSAFHTRIYITGVRTRVRTHFVLVHLVQGFILKRVRTEYEREYGRIKNIIFIQGFIYKLRHRRLNKKTSHSYSSILYKDLCYNGYERSTKGVRAESA